ncbi:MAG: paraquat-inducible protein A [Myxococcota bacterium]
MARDLDALTECFDCGLLQRLPKASEGALLTCRRCDAVLGHIRGSSVHLSLVAAVLGLALMGFALLRPAASLTLMGSRVTEAGLVEGVELLKQAGTWELGIAVALTLFIFPVLKLGSVALMAVYALRGNAPRWVKSFYAHMYELGEWAMVDVFLLGAMVALVRMRAWGEVWYGPALVALAGVAVCTLAIDALTDPRAFWKRLDSVRGGAEADGHGADPDLTAEAPDRSVPPIGCRHCGAVVRRASGQRCPRCEQTLHRRKPHSLPRTWAFLIGGTLLLLPANVLPVMTVVKMGRGGADTILSGTIELSEHGLWGLAFIVFVASIIIPIMKLAALTVLLVITRRRSVASLRVRTKVYRVVALIGRWSMIDIFATMTLVAISRFGWIGSVLPGPGASAFCAVVFLTMIASESFDPRLMWDAAGRNQPGPSLVPVTNRQALA